MACEAKRGSIRAPAAPSTRGLSKLWDLPPYEIPMDKASKLRTAARAEHYSKKPMDATTADARNDWKRDR